MDTTVTKINPLGTDWKTDTYICCSISVMAVTNNILVSYGAQSKYGAEIPLMIIGITMKVNQIVSAVLLGLATSAQPIWGYNYGNGHFLSGNRKANPGNRPVPVPADCLSALGNLIAADGIRSGRSVVSRPAGRCAGVYHNPGHAEIILEKNLGGSYLCRQKSLQSAGSVGAAGTASEANWQKGWMCHFMIRRSLNWQQRKADSIRDLLRKKRNI